ncbi:MAG: hypothetical protein GY802_26380, partial [Gammaproteobacteria bacterium]|nr:hypothetical protein [Gammaproteobacteria bacterium]
NGLNWINQGVVNWIPANVASADFTLTNATFTNQNLLLLQNASASSTIVESGTSSLVNDVNGTINLDPVTTLTISVPITNSATTGSFNLLPGSGKVTILDDIGNTNQGNIVIGANTTLQLGSGDRLQLNANTDFTGSTGILGIPGGTLDVNTAVDLSPLAITLNLNSNGAITQAQNLTIPDTFNQSGGATISGTGNFTTPLGSTVTLDDVTVNGLNWINQGVVNWIPANVASADFTLTNATFTNENLLLLQNANDSSQIVESGTSSLVNGINGTINANPTGILTILVPFTNSMGAAVTIAPGATLGLNGATLVIPTGALLAGGGTFLGNVNLNGGSIRPGDTGAIDTLAINGNLAVTAGTIEIEILNNVGAAGIGYDLLAITGTFSVADTLDLVAFGYTVSNGDSFTPITFASSSGSFGTINPVGVETVTPTYNATDLSIQLTIVGGISWIGGSSTNWADGLNWSGGIAPLISDDVSIGAFSVTIAGAANASTLTLAAGGTLDLTTGGVLTIASNASINGTLNLDGDAILQGAGTITVNGDFNWNSSSGPAIRGSGLLTTTGLTTITGVSTSFTRDWTNGGTIDWSSGVFQIQTGATFTNNATFNVDAAGSITSVNAGTETFANAATGVMNLNANAAISPDAFANAGTINLIGAGRILTFGGAGTDTGTWNL